MSYSDQHKLYGTRARTKSYAASLTVGYELDLWGKLARELEAAEWEAEATEADRQTAAIELVATTMQLYWKLGYLNERIESSEKSIAYAEKTLSLVEVQHKEGATSALEVLSARQNLAKQKASHKQYLQEKVETQNTFNLLFNMPPEETNITLCMLSRGKIPDVAEHAPSLLLHKRPDIRAAELRLRKVLADKDATLSSYLPSFSLTGSVGSSSISLKDVLTNPIGTLGAGVTLPFLNWYDARKNVQVSAVTYEKAVVEFRQTLYRAFADVEDALAARWHNGEKGKELQSALDDAKKSEALYALRYKEGSDLQAWLDAQEARRTAELSVLENRYDQLVDALTLYKALGGADTL
jgi:NodT family efflux transporter outer membrane factor (OMF) lipoprotein